MKNKLRLTERNLINLIKKIISEQTPEEIAAQYGRDVNLNLLPNYATAQPGTQPTAQPGTQPIAQPGTQPVAQRQVACQTTGYRQKSQGPYGLCDQSPAIKKLQKQFNITTDGKLGPNTLKFIRYFFQDPKKRQITDDEINNYIKQSTPDAVGAANVQTKQPMQNNAGIVVNIASDYGGTIGYVNKAYFDSKKNQIQLTRNSGAVKATTSCKLLSSNSPKAIYYKQVVSGMQSKMEQESVNIEPRLKNILYYNFCSKNVTNVNVTNLIVSELKALPTDNNRFTGQSFRAVKAYATNSIYIKNENGATILYTNCNSLSENNFYRNYGALNLPKGSIVALPNLSGAIKPSFCNTNTKA